MTTGIDITELEGLADPIVIEELDVEALITIMRDDLVERFPQIDGVIDLESEPARKLIEVFAYRELNLRARVNDAARSNLLAYALGSDLEHLGAFYDLTRLSGETDDAFRKRIILAIRGRSTGGTEPRYRAIALEADVRVADAIAYRQGSDPTVYVSIFSTDNDGVPDAALLTLVNDALQNSSVRMVNDVIVVGAATTASQAIEINVWTLPDAPSSILTDIPTALDEAWTKENGLGFDLTNSWIIARSMIGGVQRVEVVSPTYTIGVPPFQSIALGLVTVNDKGSDQ